MIEFCLAAMLFVGQVPQLPSTEIYISTADEVAAEEIEYEAIQARIESIERQLEEARNKRESAKVEILTRNLEAAVNDLNPDPSFHEHFDAYAQSIELVDNLYDSQTPISSDIVYALSDELYVDHLHPSLNYRMHVLIMQAMNEASTHPSISPEAMSAMRDSLVSYYEEGGGISSPIMETELASALFRVSDSKDAKSRQIVNSLCDDAEMWSLQLDRHDEWNHRFTSLRNHFAASDELSRIEETFTRTAPTSQPDKPDQPKVIDSLDPRQVRLEFDNLIRHHNNVEQIHRVFILATSTHGDKSLQREYMTRLLMSYYRILRKNIGVTPGTKKVIEAHLIQIAKGDRLSTKRLWQLWSRTTCAIGKNAGSALRKYVHAKNIDTKSSKINKPFVKRAIGMVRRKVGNIQKEK